tara:strand:- start:4021 stop:5112 length:1092 start_codon:yes stop_codon:yes gene_type:complete
MNQFRGDISPAFASGNRGMQPLTDEQERLQRLLEAIIVKSPGGIAKSIGEGIQTGVDVVGSIGQLDKAEQLGRQFRRTLPDIVSALTEQPGAVASALGRGIEQDVLEKGLGAFVGVEDAVPVVGKAGKLMSGIGAAAMMGKMPKMSKEVEDIVDASKRDNITVESDQKRKKLMTQETVEIYHNSPNKEFANIDSEYHGNKFSGFFGNEGGSDHGGNYSFKFDIPKNEILDHYDFTHTIPYEKTKSAVEKVAKENELEIDSDLIDELWEYIAEEKNVFQHLKDYETNLFDEDMLFKLTGYIEPGEASWQLQKMRGEVAKELGYSAVEMYDEYGTSTLIINPKIKPSSMEDLTTGEIVTYTANEE